MSTSPESARPTVHREPRTPAQLWCLLGGLTLVAVGLIGFAVNSSFDTGSGMRGSDLIIFEVNGWHDLVHLLSGLLLLAGAGHRRRAKLVSLAFGTAYLVVAIVGIANGDVFSLFHADAADNALHVALAVVSLLAGIVSRGHYDAERSLSPRLRAHAGQRHPAKL
jgi:Domain of unknown function (DUF4383)